MSADAGLAVRMATLPDWGPLYVPAGDGPFPAVLLLHGSEGANAGWSHCNAAMLAAQGFLAYPHGYSVGGNGWNAGAIVEVPLERTVDALRALRQSPLARGRLGVYGASRGGECALLLGALMARDGVAGAPDAIAVHAAADVVCGAFDARIWRDKGDPGWRAWDPAERAWTWRGDSDALTPTTPIDVARIACPLFLSCGTEDQMWSADMTRRIEARLRAAGRAPETHYHEGQGHVLAPDAWNRHLEQLCAFFRRHL